MLFHTRDECTFLTYERFDRHDPVTNIVSTRRGGVSAKPYATLNLGLKAGDRDRAVLENRAILSRAIGVNPLHLTTANQVHETRVAVVTEAEKGGGALSYRESIPRTDAMITNAPGIPLLILIADCVGVSLFDPVRRAAGVAHASWRGTLGRIAQKTVAAMEEAFGTDPADLIAGISPSIGPCCYEVRADVIEPFYKEFPGAAEGFFMHGAAPATGAPCEGRSNGAARDGESARLDLWAANRAQLRLAGVLEENIETARMCTACRTDLFYSHRKENKTTGRFGGLIVLTA